MAYIAPRSLASWAESDTATISKSHETPAANTSPSRRGRRRSAAVGRSNKTDLRFPLATSGRGDSTQEHASKEEVAPAGVIMVRNGSAEQGFHPGKKPHPGKTEMDSGKRSANTTEAGSLSTRRSMPTTSAAAPSAPGRPRWSP
jgi:hypothetical protein